MTDVQKRDMADVQAYNMTDLQTDEMTRVHIQCAAFWAPVTKQYKRAKVQRGNIQEIKLYKNTEKSH